MQQLRDKFRQRAAWLLGVAILGAAAAMLAFTPVKPAASETVYFKFDYPPAPDTFIIESSDPDFINEARAILAGTQTPRHIMGQVVKQPAPYNPPWSYYMDPASLSFFDHAIEVCDVSIAYLEEHLDEACGAFLPGCEWCPWGSRLLAEVAPPTPTPTPTPEPLQEKAYLPLIIR